MKESEIRTELDFLNIALGNINTQINDIANRETARAVLNYPAPYIDPALTQTKDDLIAKAINVMQKMEELHAALIRR